jgi:hypothetical protein
VTRAAQIVIDAAKFMRDCADVLQHIGPVEWSEMDAAIDELDATYRVLRVVAKTKADADSQDKLDKIVIPPLAKGGAA